MSSRAERDMSMAAHATPSMVGPGAYVSTGGFCSKPAKPSYAGFSSSLARGGRGGAGGGGYGGAGNNGGPGPGCVYVHRFHPPVRRRKSSSFVYHLFFFFFSLSLSLSLSLSIDPLLGVVDGRMEWIGASSSELYLNNSWMIDLIN